jgi:tripartite-type tricarboxylate transporter receptor subunit TctC
MLAVGTALCSPASVNAQTYPDRPIRMMIGFPPGGTADTIGRILAPALSERLSQPVIIENRGGAAGTLAVEAVARAFKMRAGIDVLHVPYRGGAPAVTALLAGEIDMLLVDIPVVVSHIQSGAFKALGVASEERSQILPDVPTVNEAGIAGVISEGWYAMYAPATTPPGIIDALQRAIADVLAQPPIVQAIAKVGGLVQTGAADALAAYQRAEFVKWGEVVRVSGANLN